MAIGTGKSARYMGMWGFDQAQDAKREGQAAIDTAQGSSLDALGRWYSQARADASKHYGSAVDRVNDWVTAGKGALTQYQGSLGLGGQEERDAAEAAYRASPGYTKAVQAATDETMRAASATGALGSGNTIAAVGERARDMQDRDYGQWQSQLKGVSDSGQQAATAQGQWDTQLGNTLANLGQSQGRDEAGTFRDYAGMGQNNLWNATGMGINAVTDAAKRADGNVASGYNFGVNATGSVLRLLGLGGGGK